MQGKHLTLIESLKRAVESLDARKVAKSIDQLTRRGVDIDDESISEHLIEIIDRMSSTEADDGARLSVHERAMSTFRFIRWLPEDKGLSDCVRLLAARNDPLARKACRRYLMELPWGADRLATVKLLEGLCTPPERAEEYRDLFAQALARHREPAALRTWLWGAIGQYDSTECLLGTIGDLADTDNDTDRLTYIEYLGSTLTYLNAENMAFDNKRVAAAAEAVDTGGWSRIVRGGYGTVLAKTLPEAHVNRVSGRLDRGSIAIARAWEAVRLDHMGCLIPLVLMIGSGWLIRIMLDKLVGVPTRTPWLPAVLFWNWIVWALVTMRTHFSGHETLGAKVRNGAIYFLLIAGALCAAVLVRL